MNSSEAQRLKLQGRKFTESKQDGKAFLSYRQSLTLNPNDPETCNWLGITLDNMGAYEAAIENYTRAINLDPNYEKALYNRGMAYVQTEDYQAAIDDFTEVINLDSEFSGRAKLQIKWARESQGYDIREYRDGEEGIILGTFNTDSASTPEDKIGNDSNRSVE